MTARAEIRNLLRARGIHDPRVLAAIAAVPRDEFGVHAPEPLATAALAQALVLRTTDRVLEVGTGTGYLAAVLSHIGHHVYTIERVPELAQAARVRLDTLGYWGIDVRCADGSLGWPELAPFDAIVVTACGPFVPNALVEQLEVGGRLVMPILRGDDQSLVRITKLDDLRSTVTDLGPVAFVPLIGEKAWSQHQP